MRHYLGYNRDEIYDMAPFERDLLMLIHNEFREMEKKEYSNDNDNSII